MIEERLHDVAVAGELFVAFLKSFSGTTWAAEDAESGGVWEAEFHRRVNRALRRAFVHFPEENIRRSRGA